ncbi:MAG: glutaminyl-peptide cyclotransferase [Bryobacteraceae bacterium]
MRPSLLIVLVAALRGPACAQTPVLSYQVVNVYPHDIRGFTQGLLFHDGYLYESTGNYSRSSVRKVELTSGKVLQKVALPKEYFGEGLVLWREKLIQLTWQSRIALVYDLATFRQVSSFVYPTEGWGITQDGKQLIMSDGSELLFFRDPQTFKETRRLTVRDRGESVKSLNELEYIRGEIWANIWGSERIARISPKTGDVLSWVDLKGLKDRILKENSLADVLNGIAWDAKRDRLFVTGKWWPKLFEIQVKR